MKINIHFHSKHRDGHIAVCSGQQFSNIAYLSAFEEETAIAEVASLRWHRYPMVILEYLLIFKYYTIFMFQNIHQFVIDFF